MANWIAIAVDGLKQPDVSRIVNGNFKEYSIWCLMTTLKTPGYDIGI